MAENDRERSERLWPHLELHQQTGCGPAETRSTKQNWLMNKMATDLILPITVVPVMNGHPRDQAKVSVHCRWPLVTGTDGQAGDAKYNTHCNNTYYYHHHRYS